MQVKKNLKKFSQKAVVEMKQFSVLLKKEKVIMMIEAAGAALMSCFIRQNCLRYYLSTGYAMNGFSYFSALFIPFSRKVN